MPVQPSIRVAARRPPRYVSPLPRRASSHGQDTLPNPVQRARAISPASTSSQPGCRSRTGPVASPLSSSPVRKGRITSTLTGSRRLELEPVRSRGEALGVARRLALEADLGPTIDLELAASAHQLGRERSGDLLTSSLTVPSAIQSTFGETSTPLAQLTIETVNRGVAGPGLARDRVVDHPAVLDDVVEARLAGVGLTDRVRADESGPAVLRAGGRGSFGTSRRRSPRLHQRPGTPQRVRRRTSAPRSSMIRSPAEIGRVGDAGIELWPIDFEGVRGD